MKIEFSQPQLNKYPFAIKQNKNTYSQTINNDRFESHQNTPEKFNISFGKGFFDRILEKIDRRNSTNFDELNDNGEEPSFFAKELSAGIKTFLEKDIPAKNLKSIMTPDEFREILPTLNKENFNSSRKNRESGVYCVDLDYQSNFSKGNENIFDILDNAAKYADEYYAKTGKPFIFALTDRDTLDGVKHAIRIIGENPEKYKHLKFLPAIKLTYAHEAPNSQLKYENSDMLIYGINPFSINISNFVETTIAKRKRMVINFIKQVNHLYPEFAYSVIEFAEQNRLKYKKDFTVSNLYWRAREYAETKGDTAIKSIKLVPEDVISEAEDIIDQLDQIFVGSQQGPYSASGSQIIKDSDVNKSIKEVFEEYSTHLDESQGKVVSSAENLYDDMIDCLSLEASPPVIALSAPYYLSHYYEESNSSEFPNVVEFIKDLQERSGGLLVAFESVVPSYDLDSALTPEIIKNFNNYLREHTDLYEVGGSFAKRYF